MVNRIEKALTFAVLGCHFVSIFELMISNVAFRYLQTFAHEQAILRAALIYSDGRRGTKGSRLEWLEGKF
ncbi:hypothetical protein D3C87_2159220 [compost metagenome]